MTKVIKISIHLEDGTIHYADDINTIESIINCIPKTLVFRKTTTIETLRNKYYAMEKELHKHTNTGYTKVDLHETLKPLLLKKFMDFPQYFTTNVPEYSTKNLNVEGYSALIEQLRSVSHDIFGYIFQK